MSLEQLVLVSFGIMSDGRASYLPHIGLFSSHFTRLRLDVSISMIEERRGEKWNAPAGHTT